MSERRKSGIYCIANEISGKRYIGQAASIGDRWLKHKSDLERGCHHCRHLQSSWKKHGASAFAFSVLEYVPLDKELLAEREQFWMERLAPLYNVAPSAGSSLGVKHPPRSPEFRKRQGEKRRGVKAKPETIALLKNIAAQKRADGSMYRPTPEHREKMRQWMLDHPFTAESIEKRRQKMIGRKQPAAQIAKRVAKLIGHPVSESARKRIGEANRKHMMGTKQSPELIEKRAATLRGKKRPVHVTEAMHEALRLKHEPQINAIKQALADDPCLNATHLAARLGCGRATIRKYQRQLCPTNKPSATVRISAAIRDHPNATNMKLAAIACVNVATVYKHKRDTPCLQPQPNDSADAVSGLRSPLDI